MELRDGYGRHILDLLIFISFYFLLPEMNCLSPTGCIFVFCGMYSRTSLNLYSTINCNSFNQFIPYLISSAFYISKTLTTRNGEIKDIKDNKQLAPFCTKYCLHEMYHFFLPMSSFFYDIF